LRGDRTALNNPDRSPGTRPLEAHGRRPVHRRGVPAADRETDERRTGAEVVGADPCRGGRPLPPAPPVRASRSVPGRPRPGRRYPAPARDPPSPGGPPRRSGATARENTPHTASAVPPGPGQFARSIPHAEALSSLSARWRRYFVTPT